MYYRKQTVTSLNKCLKTFTNLSRRQQGLPVKADMGVVVQEMVAAHAAGVMFTRHPITGSPREIYVTSNYGLGEVILKNCQFLILGIIISFFSRWYQPWLSLILSLLIAN